MQLRLKHRSNRSLEGRGFIIKTILVVLVLFLAVFLLDKIDMPTPTKLIKQEINNDKIITLK